MRDIFSKIKQFVSSAESQLKRAKREWAYLKNGHPIGGDENLTGHYLSSQKGYEAARRYAEKALDLLKNNPDSELEARARNVLQVCNRKK